MKHLRLNIIAYYCSRKFKLKDKLEKKLFKQVFIKNKSSKLLLCRDIKIKVNIQGVETNKDINLGASCSP